MNFNSLITLLKRGVLEPEQLWRDEASKSYTLIEFIKQIALPIVVLTAILTTLGILLFGYRVPLTDIVIHPTFNDVLMEFIRSIIMFLISIVIFGWLSAYIASILGGKYDFTKGAVMMFLVSIPSIIGRIFATTPYIGAIIAIVASIYSLVLLYKAPTVLLDLPAENKTKAFLLFFVAGIIVSIILSLTIGRLLGPSMPLLQG